MAQISEKWQVTVGKNKHIVSGEEAKLILNSGEARFVRFRDLIINPAFVQDIVLIERVNESQLEAPEVVISEEQRLRNIERLKLFKMSLKRK